MPRARCHWALLIETRNALDEALPEAYELIVRHRAEFFAGGVAPDAIRLFAGRDKLGSHFYDDQRPETWDVVVEAMCAAQPVVVDPRRLAPPTRVWLLGYLAHVLADIAYWRHVITRLPRFPDHVGVHHGAWILADQLPIPADERTLDVHGLRFDTAPPWVDEGAVRQMLDRVTGRILIPDGMWPVELTYARNRPDWQEKGDAELLGLLVPDWEANVAAARAALPAETWAAFRADAVSGAVRAITAYLKSPKLPDIVEGRLGPAWRPPDADSGSGSGV
ncbi:MAG TPA: zinc dependent phospholipase C family protein [Chloroflexota bacterium]|nr:zinc dependent phospholipase C family protein [Chloroflexota bacterium]